MAQKKTETVEEVTAETSSEVVAQQPTTSNTTNPSLEQVKAERERTEMAKRPQADENDIIPPPRTSIYVTIPAEMRVEGDDDKPVQVVQVRTFDDGSVPQVSFRSETQREYTVDWTQDFAKTVAPTARA